MEDDITASVVVPAGRLIGLPGEYDGHPSLKLAQNCEWRLFQRPDDAIHPRPRQPDRAGHGASRALLLQLPAAHAARTRDDRRGRRGARRVHRADARARRRNAAARRRRLLVCSAEPRLVDGKPHARTRATCRCAPTWPDRATATWPRWARGCTAGSRCTQPVLFPVISVLSGRRNNPPEDGDPAALRVRPDPLPGAARAVHGLHLLAHRQQSPSTTGAGSEGALTKGPFNALAATADLNNALVSMLLTGYGGFSSAAGFIGPRCRVDHDISLLIPEIWCRLYPHERDPKRLIETGHLEQLEDYEFDGKQVLASRLGYRITAKFVHTFFGRVFDNPAAVFADAILRPEIAGPGGRSPTA